MANRTLRRPSKKPTEPLVCDMFLNYDLTRLDSAQLTIEFIKFLCLQKGQIPVPFPQLQKLSYLAQKKLDTSNEFLTPREKAAALRSKRRHTHFVKKADSFQQSFEDLSSTIINNFEYQSEQVAIILGTSVFNPKEVFILDWSQCHFSHTCDSTNDSKKDFHRKQANFFRFLVTTEDLFPILQTIRPTKLHVLCHNNSSAPAIGCLPRINYRIKSSARGRQVTIRVIPKNSIVLNPTLGDKAQDHKEENHQAVLSEMATIVSRAVSRRLIFASPVSTMRKVPKHDCSLDMSGIDKLEDEEEVEKDTSVVENSISKCWFQVQCFLTGFLETFNMDT